MSNANPYAFQSVTPAAMAAADERATFLRRTYSLLLAAVLTFAATLWAAGNVEPVRALAGSMASAIFGTRFGIFLYMALFMGGAYLVHAFAERRPLNLIFFFAFAMLVGLLFAPLIYMVLSRGASGVEILNQAALITAITFGGLTGYVFYSGKDFSFLRGALSIALFALIGVAFAGWLFGFGLGAWYSVAAVVVFTGYILYDTGQILNHYPTTAHVSAACVLFVDVILLFKHILLLLTRRD